jgi:hypothetical protein
MSEKIDLPQQFHTMISRLIDAKGVYPHQMLTLDANGKIALHALAVDTPHQAMTYIAAMYLRDRPRELIYALDRFTKPGQGTTLRDCLAGGWLPPAGYQPFVIEYQHEPRIVKPIAWENEFWNAAILYEWSRGKTPKPVESSTDDREIDRLMPVASDLTTGRIPKGGQ